MVKCNKHYSMCIRYPFGMDQSEESDSSQSVTKQARVGNAPHTGATGARRLPTSAAEALWRSEAGLSWAVEAPSLLAEHSPKGTEGDDLLP